MMKVCNWLDSNQWGSLHMLDNRVYACCVRSVPLIVDKSIDYSKIKLEELQKAREALFQGINDGSRKECEGCNYLIEKEKNEIDIGEMENLLIGPITTCNLRCNYCYFG